MDEIDGSRRYGLHSGEAPQDGHLTMAGHDGAQLPAELIEREARATSPPGSVEDAVEHRITGGNEPLETAGLIAFTPCGHWWVYPTPATTEQMHDLARFNLGIACSFCLAA